MNLARCSVFNRQLTAKPISLDVTADEGAVGAAGGDVVVDAGVVPSVTVDEGALVDAD